MAVMSDEALSRLMEYYREQEMILAMLVACFGQPHEGGHRITITEQEAWILRAKIGTTEPAVVQQFQSDKLRYVIDVL